VIASMRKLICCVAIALAIPAPAIAQIVPTGHVSGIVVDSSGHPIEQVEVDATTVGRLTRTDSTGHFAIGGLIKGRNHILVRLLGWRPVETIVTIDTATPRDLRVVLARATQELAAVHIISQDECPTRTFEGFECRRRAGFGAFRDSAEIAALKPICNADMVYGMDGLRQIPGTPCSGFESTTGWRCITTLVDGRRVDGANRPPDLLSDYIGVEFYPEFDDIPEWYKQWAYTQARGSTPTRAVRGRATQYRTAAMPGHECALLVYWTIRAERYNPKVDQSKATTKAMQAHRDSLMNAHLDSIRARNDSIAGKKPPAN
jgi:hypothetical protein